MTKERPEQFVPLSVRFATGNTGTRLQERFGLEGLGVWAAFLAACKRNRPEGEIEYASEAELANVLGLVQPPTGFTLEEFFAYTGQLKRTRKTRKTRAGRVQNVRATAWERWHDVRERDAARVRKSRSRAQNQRDTGVTPPVTLPGHEAGQDRDLEVEVEKGLNPPTVRPELQDPARNGRTPVDDLAYYDTLLATVDDTAGEDYDQ
jgi:hypothetical protein